MTKAYTLGLYEKAVPGTLSWREKMLAAKKAGFDFIEISIDETDEKLSRLDMSKEERLALVQLMYETGMPIRSLCLSGHRKYPLGSNDPATCARGMEIMEKTIQFADDLGVRIIMLAGYDVYYEEGSEETRARFLENMKKSVLLAAKMGILMGFETMETEFMNTVGKAMETVNLINSPYLNVYPDAGNITNAAVAHGENVLEDLKKGAGKITSMHLKETVPGKFREIPFGTGHVDFESMIETAWKMGIRRFVTEFWYTGNAAWEEDLTFAHDMMCEIFEKQQ